MKRKIFYLIATIIFNVFFAQQERLENVLKISPPEYTNFLRYDKIPNIGFVGGIDLSIPIYEINFGIKIPISLSYNTKGFKLSDVAPNTGLGWNLTGSGTISLEVNDIDDFTKDFHEIQYDQSIYEPDPPAPCLVRIGYLSSGYNPYYPSGPPQDLKTDSSPDFYSVSAPGLKTKFYLEKDISNCPTDDCTYNYYKYNLKFLDFSPHKYDPVTRENFSFFPINNVNNYYYENNLEIKKFTIYNGEGYKYTFSEFSGQTTSYTSSNLLSYWKPANSPGSGDATLWYLTSIESPKGQKVEYIYEDFTNDYMYLYKNLTSHQEHNFGYNFNLPPYISISETEKGSHIGEVEDSFFYKTRHLGSKRLKKIIFPEGSIDFTYNNIRNDYPGHTLDKVTIKNIFGNIIKDFELQYSYFLPIENNCVDNYDCLRLRLDRIIELNKGTYKFSYGNNNGDYKLPRRSSSKIDFLGFYNNNSSNYFDGSMNAIPISKYYFYPTLNEDKIFPFKLNENLSEFTSGDTDRTPNSFSLTGLLSSITYPTGGSCELEYENDKFKYLNDEYPLGSSRIKSISYKDVGNVLVKKVNYIFTNEQGSSTGQISDFNLGMAYPLRLGTSNTYYIFSLEPTISYNLDSYVGYSKIIEYEVGKGKTEKNYVNYNTFPNVRPEFALNTYYPPNNNLALTDYEKNALKTFKIPNKNIEDNSAYRGKLISEYFYKDGINIPLSYNLYTYENKTSDLLNIDNYYLFKRDNVNITIQNIYPFKYTSTIKRKESLLKEKIEVSNLNGVNILNSITYQYKPNSNVLLKTTNNKPNGDIYVNSLFYSWDVNNQYLISKNMVGIPLQTTTTKTTNGVTKTISVLETKYPISQTEANAKTSGLPLPYEIKNSDFLGVSQTEVTYDKYDSKGNILQYTPKSGVPVAIIWGYNQTQPIAKVEGATYAQVQAYTSDIVSKSNVDIDAASEQTLITALDAFRTNSNLSAYQITTYSYDPLIGVTSITPPSGIREHYRYDTANRLDRVTDVNGNILKENTYHYKP